MQAGALTFDDYAGLKVNVDRYQENRDVLVTTLPPEFLGDMAPCEGAFYLYADISGLSGVVWTQSNWQTMLRQIHVACTPGLDFDQEQGRNHLRLSFAGSTATHERSQSQDKRLASKISGSRLA